jgi:molybdate transport system substrate-binding protein
MSAAISLQKPLTELARSYQDRHPGAKISFNFGASGSLQRQIEQGAPVDLYMSAATKQMDDLEKKSLILKETRQDLVINKLVLVVPVHSANRVRSFADLTDPTVSTISMGEPETVPAGMYALEALKALGIWEQVKGKTVLGKDVRTVLTYVETGNVEAGIVYATDAAVSSKVKIVAEVPQASYQPILYPAAVLKQSKNGLLASDFLRFLSGPEAQIVFEKYGFVTVRR